MLLRLFPLLLVLSPLRAADAQADAKGPDYRKPAFEVSQHIQKTFFDQSSGFYRESTEKEDPCFVWPGGVQFSVLVATGTISTRSGRNLRRRS